MLSKSLTGKEIAREIISVLGVSYQISSKLVSEGMRDGASTNNVAMEMISVAYTDIVDVSCLSHALDLVGDKCNTPALSGFVTTWIILFAHSPKTKMVWKELSGKVMPTYRTTMWWLKWEVIQKK